MKIAVLMTTHERKGCTLKCLGCLFQSFPSSRAPIKVFLVDAGSQDGTPSAIRVAFPEVEVIEEGREVFWNSGMRRAWEVASGKDFDGFLWLNNDVFLYAGALEAIFNTMSFFQGGDGKAFILVGSTCDPTTSTVTYGGYMRGGPWRPLDLTLVQPENKLLPCVTMNGNCVLVSRRAYEVLGNLSPLFHHGMGDFDYGFRAARAGVPCFVLPGIVGECSRNSSSLWTLPETPMRDRIRILLSPKGLPPQEWLSFTRSHTGWKWPYYWIKPYLRVLLPGLWRRTKGA